MKLAFVIPDNFQRLDLNVVNEAEMEYLVLITLILKLKELTDVSHDSLAENREKCLTCVNQSLEFTRQLLYSSFSGLVEVKNQLMTIKVSLLSSFIYFQKFRVIQTCSLKLPSYNHTYMRL